MLAYVLCLHLFDFFDLETFDDQLNQPLAWAPLGTVRPWSLPWGETWQPCSGWRAAERPAAGVVDTGMCHSRSGFCAAERPGLGRVSTFGSLAG